MAELSTYTLKCSKISIPGGLIRALHRKQMLSGVSVSL